MRVFRERDRIILDLGGRRRDVWLGWKAAEETVSLLRAFAAQIDDWLAFNPPSLLTQAWRASVVSYDGVTWIRFVPESPGCPERVPLTAKAARALADRIEFSSQQAAYKMRFEFA